MYGSLFCVALLITLLLGCYEIESVRATSHYCNERRSYHARELQSRTLICGWYGRCIYYYYVLVTRYYQKHICCSGYSGAGCNIPVCSPACEENAVCHDVNSCFCRPGTAGNTCGSPVYCSFQNDCYPGTCFGVNSCRCSSGFEGTSCSNIRDGGGFDHCKITINHGELVTYESDCLKPNGNVNTNIANLVDVKLEWKVTWQLPPDTPAAPSYVIASRPGIVESYSRLKLYNELGQLVYNQRQECTGHNVSATNPFLTVECRNVYHSITPNSAHHKYKLEISYYSKSGGFKTIKNERDQTVQTRNFIGTSHDSDQIEIKFDMERPIHCSQKEQGPCQYDDQPPLALYPDTIQGTELKVQVFGWEDLDSSIKEYRFSLYQLEYNTQLQKLVQGDVSLHNLIWDPKNDPPTLSVSNPGVYSIVMEVVDFAGNTAKARTLFTADQENNVQVEDNYTIQVDNKVASDTGFWIKENGDFNIQWANLFINRHHMVNHFLAEVKKEVSINLDDDDTGNGNRTVQAVPNFNGITRFELGWRKPPLSQMTWENIDDLSERVTITNIDREDGDVIEFTINGYDTTGYKKSHIVQVNVDSSPPELSRSRALETKFNVDSEVDDIYYASRLIIPVTDLHSGIGSISFTLIDDSKGFDREIRPEVIQTAPMHPGSMRRKCESSNKCYCTNFDACYDTEQSIWVDNCWFKDDALDSLNLCVAYSVSNNAGIKLAHRQHTVGKLKDLEGVGYYPTPKDIGTTRNRGDTLDVIWYLPPSCYQRQQIILTYTQAVKHVATLTGNVTRHTLHGLIPNSKFDISFEIVFVDGTRKKTDPVSFSTEFSEQSSSLSIGGIAGIVIAIIIFLILIAALLFMFTRYKRNRHPVPLVLREARDSARDAISKRFSRHPLPEISSSDLAHYDNNQEASAIPGPSVRLDIAYASEEDDMYIYGNMDTDPNASWKYTGDSLTITKNVPGAKGRFADIKLGELNTSGGTTTVVVKMNKSGASEEDKLLMRAKMNFLATALSRHDLVVGVIGGVPDPKGPMILMEYCNSGTLLAWLQKLVKVTGDIEDQMVTFTIQCATGMAFLHDKGILHRRLGARNVLLHTNSQTKQIVAKLSGFGPLKGEQDKDGYANKDDRVPIKWMAPEQLNKPAGQKRLYTQKTDVWSYGVLVWEIFSKGGKPYSDKTVAEMKAFVKLGSRMGRTQNCPQYMYDEVIVPCWEADPDMRPIFDILLAKLNREYGAQGGDLYDYDRPDFNRMPEKAMQVD